MKIRILMVTHYFGSHQGGIEIVAERIFQGLDRTQCEVVWAAADVTPPPLQTDSCHALRLRSSNRLEGLTGLPFPVPAIGALCELHREVSRADVVILHDCLYASNVAAFLSAQSCRVPVLIVQHIGAVPYKNVLLAWLMKLANRVVARPMLARAKQVVFVSGVTKQYFDGVAFRHPPAMIFNGVDTAVFHPLPPGESRAAMRQRLGLPVDRPVALFVGRFVEKKGLAVLRHMAAMEPRITWAFAGWGRLDPRSWTAGDVRVYSDLRAETLAQLYQASDVFVLPSTGEGFPLVIQEAIACGLPVVCGAETATADDAMAAFVRGVNLRTGDDEGSASDFLASVHELLDRGSNAEEVKQRHEFVCQRYSWHRAVEKYLELARALTDCQSGQGETVAIPGLVEHLSPSSSTHKDVL
jgi:glycosyltransferase involved in cell wall biosynthesis